MICISCNNEHDEKFCPYCGEKSVIKKITFVAILSEAFSTITNMDKGFLFNFRQLSTNTGHFISKYVDGKRKGIFNPISYFKRVHKYKKVII